MGGTLLHDAALEVSIVGGESIKIKSKEGERLAIFSAGTPLCSMGRPDRSPQEDSVSTFQTTMHLWG